eukprot:250642_1
MSASVLVIILAITAIMLFAVIYVPVLAYYAYKTKQYEHHTVMHKRNVRLTILLSILSICWILSFIFSIFVYTFIDTDIAISISNFLIITIYIAFTYTLTWRLWLIFFKIIYNISISQISWEKLISNEAGSKNWYIKEQTMSKWGNPLWVQKFMVYVIFINVLLYAIFHFITFIPIINFIIRLIIIFIPWIVILIIHNKIPQFYDEIGIEKEIKYMLIGYFIMGVFFICLFIAVSISIKNNNHIIFHILYFLSYHLLAFSAFLTSMTMTYYPLKKYLILNNNYFRIQYSSTTSSLSLDSPRMLSDKHNPLLLKLESICLTMFGMDLLMKFLEKEYSRENLLFIIEVTLLQKSIYEHIKNNGRFYIKQNIDLNKIGNCIFMLPSTCPQSAIINDDYDTIID